MVKILKSKQQNPLWVVEKERCPIKRYQVSLRIFRRLIDETIELCNYTKLLAIETPCKCHLAIWYWELDAGSAASNNTKKGNTFAARLAKRLVSSDTSLHPWKSVGRAQAMGLNPSFRRVWWWGVWHLLGKAGFSVESIKHKSLRRFWKATNDTTTRNTIPCLLRSRNVHSQQINQSPEKEGYFINWPMKCRPPPPNEWGGTLNKVSWKKSLPTCFNLYLSQPQIHFRTGPRLIPAMIYIFSYATNGLCVISELLSFLASSDKTSLIIYCRDKTY